MKAQQPCLCLIGLSGPETDKSFCKRHTDVNNICFLLILKFTQEERHLLTTPYHARLPTW